VAAFGSCDEPNSAPVLSALETIRSAKFLGRACFNGVGDYVWQTIFPE
jgi:hypothetical protein